MFFVKFCVNVVMQNESRSLFLRGRTQSDCGPFDLVADTRGAGNGKVGHKLCAINMFHCVGLVVEHFSEAKASVPGASNKLRD